MRTVNELSRIELAFLHAIVRTMRQFGDRLTMDEALEVARQIASSGGEIQDGRRIVRGAKEIGKILGINAASEISRHIKERTDIGCAIRKTDCPQRPRLWAYVDELEPLRRQGHPG
jgi:hypothetical protein